MSGSKPRWTCPSAWADLESAPIATGHQKPQNLSAMFSNKSLCSAVFFTVAALAIAGSSQAQTKPAAKPATVAPAAGAKTGSSGAGVKAGVGATAPKGAPSTPAVTTSSFLPAGLPENFNTKIPIPAGAEVIRVGQQSGVVRDIDLIVPGTYENLITFYTTALKKNGFYLGTPVKIAVRKAYNLTFSSAGQQNTVSLYPSEKDPTKFNLHIVYEVTGAKEAKPPTTAGAAAMVPGAAAKTGAAKTGAAANVVANPPVAGSTGAKKPPAGAGLY